jgi:hypothetical protein
MQVVFTLCIVLPQQNGGVSLSVHNLLAQKRQYQQMLPEARIRMEPQDFSFVATIFLSFFSFFAM